MNEEWEKDEEREACLKDIAIRTIWIHQTEKILENLK